MTVKNLQYESGRSMVEMLGTLAIIGVLSVGGIAGYSYGMNKYHANEAINDVNLRMIDVATHVMRGVQIDQLDSAWGESKSGYDIELFHDSDSEPSIIVKQVPTGICKEILKSTPDTQDIFVGSENADGMDGSWYLGDNEHICDNGDKDMLFALSPEILAGFNPDGEDYVEPEGTATVTPKPECSSNADCRPEAPYCDNGTCIQCNQDSHCPSNLPYCDTAKNVCHECVSNDDCDAGQFCADSNETESKAAPYTCKNLNFSSINLTNEEGVTETWHYSNEPMTWWDTKHACEAMNLRMTKWEDLSSGWTSFGNGFQYCYIRPHVKTLYGLFKKHTGWNAVSISNQRLFVLNDGFMPNSGVANGGYPRNKADLSTGGLIIYGVCK